MYLLHIANKNYSSWSLRPWVLMRALDIPFREHVHRFLNHGTYEAFRAFSPTGRVPCLHDGPTVVWDSLGIAEYLAERHEGVWAADPATRAGRKHTPGIPAARRAPTGKPVPPASGLAAG